MLGSYGCQESARTLRLCFEAYTWDIYSELNWQSGGV